MNRYLSGYPTIYIICILMISGCAKRGTPEGGPIDEEPPVFVKARPENFSTHFDAKEIRIYFDEYIKMEDPQKQIIISPPMDPAPVITPLGTASKSIRIKISDTLQPGTTYTINFGRSITDNNEGNPLDYFTYVFSTGAYIDSLTVSGTVSDALLKRPDPFISVMLYEVDSAYTDSTIYKEVPRYITSTLDSATTFQLKNLKAGKYRLIGLKDANNNNLFDPSLDKIAFTEGTITIPTDSVFHLTLFREELPFKFMRPDQESGQHVLFGYQGQVQPDSLEIGLLTPNPQGFTSTIVKDREKDSLHYWFKPKIEGDSLVFAVRMDKYKDTLVTRLKEMDRDSVNFAFQPTSSIPFDQELKVLPSIPLIRTNDSLIQIVDQDTLPVTFTTQYDEWNNEFQLSFDKKEDQTYEVTIFPGAFTGFFGKDNDTLRARIRTLALSDYGNLQINLLGVESFPIIAQLTSEGGEVKEEVYSTGGTSLSFRSIQPGTYFLRLVYDKNKNRSWDTGDYLRDLQPEKVVYFPEPLDVRANWDVTQTFTIE